MGSARRCELAVPSHKYFNCEQMRKAKAPFLVLLRVKVPRTQNGIPTILQQELRCCAHHCKNKFKVKQGPRILPKRYCERLGAAHTHRGRVRMVSHGRNPARAGKRNKGPGVQNMERHPRASPGAVLQGPRTDGLIPHEHIQLKSGTWPKGTFLPETCSIHRWKPYLPGRWREHDGCTALDEASPEAFFSWTARVPLKAPWVFWPTDRTGIDRSCGTRHRACP